MRTAALIQGIEMENVIVLADGQEGDATLAWYADHDILCVEITGMDPMPGLGAGWTYVDGEWIAPPKPEPTPPIDPK